jgi:transcriptional regulator with XRE-family HTH domain
MSRAKRSSVFTPAADELVDDATRQFGKRVQELMVHNGWIQSDLAERAELPRDSISAYVRGRFLPAQPNLLKLAEALGVAPEILVPGYVAEPSFEDALTSGPSFDGLDLDRVDFPGREVDL